MPLPIEIFSSPIKQMGDDGVTFATTAFLERLRQAMRARTTPRLNRSGRRLVRRFDRAFRRARTGARRSRLAAGARAAHAQIVDNYLSSAGSRSWISFQNIGDWGRNYLDRSSIAEYIQWGNGYDTAAYYHTFRTWSGIPLNADFTNPHGYVLRFERSRIPDAERFWSLTAYLPESITLVPNALDKYVVASYTPGLHTNADGSITVFMTPQRPTRVPEANWLPVPAGPFNVMLRVYGPQGSVADGSYRPPGIRSLRLAP